MNNTQLRKENEKLAKEIQEKGFGWQNGKFFEPSKEIKKKQTALNCISMINSIICYNAPFGENATQIFEEDKKSGNYLEDYTKVLGKNEVIKLIEEQLKSIKGIKNNVFIDEEGTSYNSIAWGN